MWREGMWYDNERSTAEVYLRNGIIVVAAFVVTGGIFLALQRSMDSVNKGISRTYQGDDAGVQPTFANAPSASLPMGMPLNAYTTTPPIRTNYVPVQSVPPPAPIYNIPTAYRIFANDAEREQARRALADLRVTLKDFQDYNTHNLQKALSTGKIASVEPVNINDNDLDTVSEALGRQNQEIQAQQNAIEKVAKETEALGSLLTLTAHPDRFPDALRDGVGEMSRELHTYLQDVRDAVAEPEERSRLLSLASQHLSRSESILQQMERDTNSVTL